MSDAIKFLVAALRPKKKAKPVKVDRHIRMQAARHAMLTGGRVYFHHPSEGFVPLGMIRKMDICVNVFPDYTEFTIIGTVNED